MLLAGVGMVLVAGVAATVGASSTGAAGPTDAVVHAREYTSDPAAGGRLLLEEWAVPGTPIGRSESPDEIKTLDGAPCASSGSAQCFERRTATRWSATDPGMTEDYTVHKWAQNDPAIEPVTLISIAPEGRQTASGPIGEASQAWQTLPPGHGTSYQLYEQTASDEDSGDETHTKLWIDATTGLPIRQASSNPAGDVLSETFWTYDAALRARNELPEDLFSVKRPENTASDTSSQSLITLPLGTQRDQETARTFAPFSLGSGVVLGGRLMCFLGAQTVNSYDRTTPDEFDDPDADLLPDAYGPLTWVDADYGAAQRGGQCALGTSDTPVELSVRSFQRDSSMGRAYRDAYDRDGDQLELTLLQGGTLLGVNLPLGLGGLRIGAHVVTGADGELSSLLEIGDTEVEITGAVTTTELSRLAGLLQAR